MQACSRTAGDGIRRNAAPPRTVPVSPTDADCSTNELSTETAGVPLLAIETRVRRRPTRPGWFHTERSSASVIPPGPWTWILRNPPSHDERTHRALVRERLRAPPHPRSGVPRIRWLHHQGPSLCRSDSGAPRRPGASAAVRESGSLPTSFHRTHGTPNDHQRYRARKDLRRRTRGTTATDMTLGVFDWAFPAARAAPRRCGRPAAPIDAIEASPRLDRADRRRQRRAA